MPGKHICISFFPINNLKIYNLYFLNILLFSRIDMLLIIC